LQFYFRYVERLPRTVVPASMVLGSAVHAALAAYHRGLQAGSSLAFHALEATFLQSWQSQQRDAVINYRSGQSQNSLHHVGLSLLRQYTEEPPPERIRSVEQPLYVPIYTISGHVLERPLLAVADLVTENDEGLVVHEFKTSSRAYSTLEADLSLQARCYVHAAEEAWGQPASVRFTVFVKAKRPRIQRLDTTRDLDNSSRLGEIVNRIERAVLGDAFFPVETPQNCVGCSYRRECKDWGSDQLHRPRILKFSTNGRH